MQRYQGDLSADGHGIKFESARFGYMITATFPNPNFLPKLDDMSRLFLSFLLLAIFASVAVSQTPTPTPSTDSNVVKITTNLVQIDVTVTDSKGKPIRDLKADEFELYENGKKQDISNFSFVSSVRETNEKSEKKDQDPANIVPVPPSIVRSEQVRRAIALVVDDLSLSFESVAQVKRALKKYVDEQMQEGDLVAIIRTSAGIGALQQFTTNKAQLYAAIEKVKWFPLGSGNISAFAPIEPTLNELRAASGDQNVTQEDIEAEKNALQSFDDFRDSTFAVGTLGALRYIVTGMSELPGRKSVILFSDGIRLFPRDPDGSTSDNRLYDFMQELIDFANRSSVVFYTIDARGLVTTGISAQDQIVIPTAENLSNTISNRNAEIFDTQQGLAILAQETGGIAVVNNNDLSGGVRRIVDDQSYYLLGYVPDDDTFDAQKRKFNKLEIKVTRPGANVRYRSGFINVASDTQIKKTAPTTPLEAIQYALTSPFAVNDISLRLNALFGFEPKRGTFVRSLIHVKASDLMFVDEPDGTKKAIFDVVAVSYGDNGVPIDQLARTYTLRVPKASFERFLRDGFVYHFTFPIKKPGPYQLRVALRDEQNSKVGSASQFIEVPNLKKDRLTVSGIILENYTPEQWKNFAGPAPDPTMEGTDPLSDTSTRLFKRGSILRYGVEVYNAKLDPAKRPNLRMQIRIYRDRQLVLDGKPNPVELAGQSEFVRVRASGALSLPVKMVAGDYVLQVIIVDDLAKTKTKIATQFVQFEVTE